MNDEQFEALVTMLSRIEGNVVLMRDEINALKEIKQTIPAKTPIVHNTQIRGASIEIVTPANSNSKIKGQL